MHVRPSTAALASLVAASLCAAPQEVPPAEAPRISRSVELSILNLDVLVTGKDGKPFHGLMASDFEVRLDKRTVPIENFSEYVSAPPASGTIQAPAAPAPAAPAPAEAPASAGEPAPVRPKRSVALFLDHLSLPYRDQREEFFRSLKSLLARTLGPGDEVMVVTWNRAIRAVIPFTSDRETVERFLDAEAGRSARPNEETAELDQLSKDAAIFQSVDPALAGAAGVSQRFLAAQAYAEMQRKATALRSLIATLGGLEGKKVLVFVSHRFSRYAGLHYFLGKRAGIGEPQPEESKEFDAKAIVDSVADAANAHGVTLYPVLPAGWEVGFSSAADPASDNPGFRSGVAGEREQVISWNEKRALDVLAEKTGGRTAMGTVDFDRMVPQVVEDLGSYYSLGIAAPKGGNDKTYSLAVTVKGRPDLNVRSRREVVDKSDVERMKDRVLANLFGKVPSSSRLAIKVARKAPVQLKKKRYRTSLDVQVPIGSLATTPTGRGEAGSFSVFLASASPDGSFSEVTRQTRTFEIPRGDLAKARTSHFTYNLEVETSSPESRLSIGVQDDVGKEAGFVRLSLE